MPHYQTYLQTSNLGFSFHFHSVTWFHMTSILKSLLLPQTTLFLLLPWASQVPCLKLTSGVGQHIFPRSCGQLPKNASGFWAQAKIPVTPLGFHQLCWLSLHCSRIMSGFKVKIATHNFNTYRDASRKSKIFLQNICECLLAVATSEGSAPIKHLIHQNACHTFFGVTLLFYVIIQAF